MAQSERNSHSKNRGGEKLNKQLGTYTKKTYRKLVLHGHNLTNSFCSGSQHLVVRSSYLTTQIIKDKEMNHDNHHDG